MFQWLVSYPLVVMWTLAFTFSSCYSLLMFLPFLLTYFYRKLYIVTSSVLLLSGSANHTTLIQFVIMGSYAHSNCFSQYGFQLEAIFLSTGDPRNISEVQMCSLKDISPLTYTRVLIFLTTPRNILSDKLNILL